MKKWIFLKFFRNMQKVMKGKDREPQKPKCFNIKLDKMGKSQKLEHFQVPWFHYPHIHQLKQKRRRRRKIQPSWQWEWEWHCCVEWIVFVWLVFVKQRSKLNLLQFEAWTDRGQCANNKIEIFSFDYVYTLNLTW